MKLHLCAGDIYLDGYINCDIDGVIYEAELMPNPNITTLDNYFKFPFIQDTKERQKNRRPIIIDRRVNLIECWPFDDNSVDELVLVSALEHFTKEEGKYIASEINRVTKSGAKVLISVPDLKATVDRYYDSDPEHCMVLVFCNWKNIYSAHKWMYSKNTLMNLFGDGWAWQQVNTINHDFPAIQIEGIKN